MVLKDILADCILKLGYSDSVDITAETLSAADQKIVNRLVQCANIVYAEIATDYIPIIVKETVTLDNGVIDIAELANRLLYVVSVKQNGVAKRFRLYSSYIESTFSGEAVIEYASLPETMAVNSEVPETRLPAWLFAEGICAEYCYAENLTDMSVAFDNKFREDICKLKNKSDSRYVKARGWY